MPENGRRESARARFGNGSVTTGVRWPRSSGVLAHVTSLPSATVGDDARRFLDWLADAGQRWWQVLPLGPPDALGSPYSASSAFAAWPGLLARPARSVSVSAVESFVAVNRAWIGDWAAFAGDGAIADQVRFDREWSVVRAHARDRGISILGDLAFYVARGSADHRFHPEQFRSGVVAGVPPDDWSATGQLWGNPVYDWARAAADGYRWWSERFRRALALFDAVRVDHFRGFVAYWEVPAGARTAIGGRWVRGPGRAVFDAVRAELGDLPIVAENLGLITPAVERLRRAIGAPGNVVLQFAFSGRRRDGHAHVPEDAVVYTGTHDNDTTVGWWRRAPELERENVRRALGAVGDDTPSEPHWGMIRLALRSPARVAIVPAQDVLGLGSEARMNTPGTTRGNWSWRLTPGQLTRELARRLRGETEAAGRLRT